MSKGKMLGNTRYRNQVNGVTVALSCHYFMFKHLNFIYIYPIFTKLLKERILRKSFCLSEKTISRNYWVDDISTIESIHSIFTVLKNASTFPDPSIVCCWQVFQLHNGLLLSEPSISTISARIQRNWNKLLDQNQVLYRL